MKRPKKLNLYEMWELYSYLGKGLTSSNEYLIDEMDSLLDKVSKASLLQAINLMYPKHVLTNPVEVILLLVRGIKRNQLILFRDFIKGLTSDRSTS